jgi:hypothetical protein
MHRASDQFPLFSSAPLRAELYALADTIPRRVRDVAEPLLRARSALELIDDLAGDLRMAPLEVDEDGIRVEQQEFEDPNGVPYSGGGPPMRPWLRVILTVPFKGNLKLWRLKPSTFPTTAPQAALLIDPAGASGFLEMIFEQPPWEPLEKIKDEFERQLERVRFYIMLQRRDLAEHEHVIQTRLAAEVSNRRSRLTKRENLADLLGIGTAKAATPGLPSAGSPASSETAGGGQTRFQLMHNDYWDVFVSHASEDKESFARPLAEALQATGLRVWFDESTLRVGDSLRRSIDRGLAKSRFGVVVISKAFLCKEWPQRELDGLVAREEDGTKVVLPIWHDVTVSEVRSRSPTLADRLAIPSSRGLEATVAELLQVIRSA